MIGGEVGEVGMLGLKDPREGPLEAFKQGSDMIYDFRGLLWLLCGECVDWRGATICKDQSPQAPPSPSWPTCNQSPSPGGSWSWGGGTRISVVTAETREVLESGTSVSVLPELLQCARHCSGD